MQIKVPWNIPDSAFVLGFRIQRRVSMRKNYLNVAAVFITVLALVSFFDRSHVRPASAQSDCQTFPQTGMTVCGKFLQYWNNHGGLAQQGYPISAEFQEVSDVDGKTYTVQYFERAEFELHPENQPPFDVELTLLGSMALKQKYPNGAPAPPTANNPNVGQYFPQTGQWVSDPFLSYWKSHGGLMQQGYPISGRFTEKSDLDGKLYTVQYFERAVFELHPENQPPFDVLLSQLGTERYKAKYPNVPGSGTAIKTGDWGAQGVSMNVTASSVHFEFDCAHADIPQTITVDPNGQFSVTGTFVQEHGGPTYVGDDQGRPANFTGNTDGIKLNVTITYADDNSKVGSWTVAYGSPGKIMKCM
jgi:hypothetical protein